MNVMQLLLKRYKRRINKVIKGGSVLSILFAFTFSLIIPPFNIYADTLSMSNIVGVNYTVSNSIVVGTVTYNNMTYNRYSTDYNVEIKLDDSYLGWCQLTIEYDYYDRDSSGIVSKNTNETRRIYINGDTAHIDINILNNYGSQPLQVLVYNPRVTTITNSNVVPYGELSTLTDIYNVLLDIQQNVSDSENILNDILTFREWDFPFESFPFAYDMIYRYSLFEPSKINKYTFPVIDIKQGDHLPVVYLNSKYKTHLIFACNKSFASLNGLKTLFTDNYGHNLDDFYYSVSYLNNDMGTNPVRWSFYHYVFKPSSNYSVRLDFLQDCYFIPIYYNSEQYGNVSTDFALLFGLSNQLLDDLHIIANGTNQTNSSSSSLETQKDTFDTTSNNLYNSENAFNTDMNSKLQSIDTSFNPSTSFGSKFLSSADWVRTQFNNLTSTSPFGTVLSFSMLLGLSLLIIGKVFK